MGNTPPLAGGGAAGDHRLFRVASLATPCVVAMSMTFLTAGCYASYEYGSGPEGRDGGSNSSSFPDDGDSFEEDMRDVSHALLRADCENALNCRGFARDVDYWSNSSSAGRYYELGVTSSAACADVTRSWVDQTHFMRHIVPQLRDGTIEYDPEYTASCIDELLGDEYCGSALWALYRSTSLTTGACHQMLRGRVPLGRSCEYDFECAQDGICGDSSGPTSRPGDCDRTCRRPTPLGTACSTDDDCTHGAWGMATCSIDFVCVPVTPRFGNEGELCDPIDEDEARVDLPCGDGLWCTQGSRCARMPELGEPCEPRTDILGMPCGLGLVCRDDEDGARCAPDGIGRVEGDPCEEDLLGRSGSCSILLGLACSDAGRCERLIGDGTLGSRCSMLGQVHHGNPGLQGCRPGLGCVLEEGADFATCAALLPDGAVCDSRTEAAPFYMGICESGACQTTAGERDLGVCIPHPPRCG